MKRTKKHYMINLLVQQKRKTNIRKPFIKLTEKKVIKMKQTVKLCRIILQVSSLKTEKQ